MDFSVDYKKKYFKYKEKYLSLKASIRGGTINEQDLPQTIRNGFIVNNIDVCTVRSFTDRKKYDIAYKKDNEIEWKYIENKRNIMMLEREIAKIQSDIKTINEKVSKEDKIESVDINKIKDEYTKIFNSIIELEKKPYESRSEEENKIIDDSRNKLKEKEQELLNQLSLSLPSKIKILEENITEVTDKLNKENENKSKILQDLIKSQEDRGMIFEQENGNKKIGTELIWKVRIHKFEDVNKSASRTGLIYKKGSVWISFHDDTRLKEDELFYVIST